MSGSGSSDDAKGAKVLGGYELLERLSASVRDGTYVYRAHQKSLGRTVRMTILPPSSVKKATYRASFERMVAVMSRIRHDNIVSAIDAGSAQGCLYVVFEDTEGRTLADMIARATKSGGRISTDRISEIGADACRALDHLASQGLVHRNVVPSTVLIPEHGPAKLSGLGVAKVRVANASETFFEHDPETAGAAAPEMVRGTRGVDIRADLYALGCVLFHAATLRPVFDGPNVAAVLARHVTDTPPDPRTLRDDLPDAFVRVLDRCLRKSPRERHQKPADLVADLDAVRARKPVERGPGTPLWKERKVAIPSILRRAPGKGGR